ncbi:MAG TPA: hypothetical protein PLH94_01400 [Fimbriimonadaceae bacterium]|nr:hypothetical protein [Fimbriimonadaceae bacterium]
MARFKNFSIWRGRLPHWRADEEIYYVSFRSRRPLDETERLDVFRALLKPDGSRWLLRALVVAEEKTEMIFTVCQVKDGVPIEFAKPIEAAKRRAGNAIMKRTGERFPPFYVESFDRIIRDEAELLERTSELARTAERLAAIGGETFWFGEAD